MQKSNIMKGVAVLGAVAIIGGGVVAANAATNGFTRPMGRFGKSSSQSAGQDASQGQRTPLTAAQKAARQAQMAAVKTALDNGDYNAWVTAVTAVNPNSPQLKQVTSANFSAYVAKNKTREAAMAAMQTKMTAVQAAVTAGDYNAWVTAVTALNAKSPLLSKINSGNFTSYVQARNLQTQAASIMKTLGVNGLGIGRPTMSQLGTKQLGQ